MGRVSTHHATRGLGERRNLSSLSWVWGGARPKMDFMHILGQKEAIWNTIFSIFERRRAPKRRGARETPPPSRRAWRE